MSWDKTALTDTSTQYIRMFFRGKSQHTTNQIKTQNKQGLKKSAQQHTPPVEIHQAENQIF